MIIRRAKNEDIDMILNLLSQVLEVHASLRPDLFIHKTTKYTKEDLERMITDDSAPIYVADEDGLAVGYAICAIMDSTATNCTYACRELYIDDLCVDEKMRGRHVAENIFEYVKKEAKNLGCERITLSVWAGNTPAERFYQKMGMTPRKTMMEIKL